MTRPNRRPAAGHRLGFTTRHLTALLGLFVAVALLATMPGVGAAGGTARSTLAAPIATVASSPAIEGVVAVPSPSTSPTYNVTFRAPGLGGGQTFFFYLDSVLYSAPGNGSITAAGLAVGKHTITGASASPHLTGWEYFGTPSSGSVFALPGVSDVNFTFSYENMSSPITTFQFTESQLPAGVVWDLWFNGTFRSSNTTTISTSGHPGSYVVIPVNATGPTGTAHYVPNALPTPLNLSANEIVNLTYTTQLLLQVFGGPGGSVLFSGPNNSELPAGSYWEHLGTLVNLSAVGDPTYYFKGWTGTGVGSYTGEAPKHSILIEGPTVELAVFLPRPADYVSTRITEAGLPNGTIWTVYFGGVGYSSGRAVVAIPNLFSCTNPPLGQSGNYALSVPEVFENQTNPGLSAAYLPVGVPPVDCGGVNVNFTFTPTYLILDQATLGGSITASDSNGSVGNQYVAPNASVSFTAFPSSGYTFESWQGMGNGNYTGLTANFSLKVVGSVEEVASFAPNPPPGTSGYPIDFTVPATEMVAPQWSVTVDGESYAASGLMLATPPLPPGSHLVQVATATTLDGLSRSVPAVAAFSVNLGAAPATVNLSFTIQYWVAVGTVGSGNVTPGSTWADSGRPLLEQAMADAGSSLVGWQGVGPGAYNGSAATASLNITGPVTESATFGPAAPPPDFWHRNYTLAGAAATSLIVGFLAAWMLFRRREKPPTGPRAAASGSTKRDPAPPLPSDRGGPPTGSASPQGTATLLLALTLLVVSSGFTAWASSPHISLLAPSEAPLPLHSSETTSTPPAPAAGPAATVASGAPGPTERGVGPPPTSPTLPQPAISVTIQFHATGLPNGTVWAVSVWRFEAAVGSPETVSGNSSNLSADASSLGHAVDFAVWTLPSNSSGAVWFGTPNVTAPMDPSTTPNVTVHFALVSVAGLTLRVHVVAVGLPAATRWNASFEGAGYAFTTPTSDWSIGGAKSAAFDASPIYPTIAPNPTQNGSDIAGFPPAYFPESFDLLNLQVGTSWTNASSGPVAFTARADAWIEVNFTTAYHVRIVASTGGSVSPSTGWFPAGVPVGLVATPAAGYALYGWAGNGSGSVTSADASITVTPIGTLTEVAMFVATPYNITVSETGVPAGQTYSIVFNGGIYSANNSSFALPAVPAGDYEVSVPYALDNGTPGERFVPTSLTSTYASGPNSTIAVNGNGVIFITFETQFSLSVAVIGDGSAVPGNGSYWEPEASVVAIAATSNSNAVELQSWSGTGTGSTTGTAAAILVTMDGVVTETAHFGVLTEVGTGTLTVTESGLPPGTSWTVAAGARGGGASTAQITVPFVPTAMDTLTVPPVVLGAGVRFVPQGSGSYFVPISGNTSFIVSFREQFQLAVVVGFGGSVAAYPAWVDANTTVSLLAQGAAAGYQFLGWSGALNATTALLSVKVAAPITLRADFGPNGATAASTGPKDAAIAAADIGIPLVIGVLAAWLWLRYRRRR